MAGMVYNHFGACGDALDKAASAVVRKTALDAQAHIQSNVQANGLVRTGFLLNSVYVVTSESSSYKGGAKALPEVAQPTDDKTAYVVVGAQYGIFPELGTRFMAARPYFYPGIDATRPDFEAAMAQIKTAMEEAARQ